MSTDASEIHKFDSHGADWWSKKGPFRFLHQINPLRLEWINAQSPLNGKKVLDVGCGGGILSEAMAKAGASVTGIDLSGPAIDAAIAHAIPQQLDIDYHKLSLETLSLENPHAFDAVTCMEMLEHVPEPASIVTHCARLVKPGGHVFFATLNRNMRSFLHAIVGAEFLLRLLPLGTHQFKRFITPAELSHAARLAGLNVQAITGVTFKPLTGQFTLTQDVRINYMMVCSLPL